MCLIEPFIVVIVSNPYINYSEVTESRKLKLDHQNFYIKPSERMFPIRYLISEATYSYMHILNKNVIYL